MRTPPMYPFVVEEVTGEGRILTQAIIFGHNGKDALERHSSMFPRNAEMEKRGITFRAFPYAQTVAVMSPSYSERMQSIATEVKGEADVS